MEEVNLKILIDKSNIEIKVFKYNFFITREKLITMNNYIFDTNYLIELCSFE